MSTTSTEDFERSCDQVFNKLQELAQELKSHDHEEIHFNIEHAAQYVEHNKIGVKFKEQVRLLNGDVSYELICAINDCNTHLNDCMSICKRMGTPSWSTEQDSRLTMSWTFVYASLSKAGLILKLKPLEAQAFLAFNRQQPSFEPPTISRRESFMSNAGSENFTIEGRAERRERAERQRQGQRREPMLVTPTGTRLRTQPNRTSASVRSVAASTSAAPSSTASLRLPTRPAVPEREKWVINPSIYSQDSTTRVYPNTKGHKTSNTARREAPSPSTNAIYAFTSAINEVLQATILITLGMCSTYTKESQTHHRLRLGILLGISRNNPYREFGQCLFNSQFHNHIDRHESQRIDQVGYRFVRQQRCILRLCLDWRSTS
ncbi:hypothetical protein QSH57_002437 [Fusarium oxysporum f. sp. vasinfectum]|nr:hypothetical protein QSH57_002437 [Fusarium oxysporum f. sp. vasinfectum]